MFGLNWVGLGSGGRWDFDLWLLGSNGLMGLMLCCGGWGFGLISVSLFGRVDCDWGIGRLWGLVFRCDLNGG